MNNQIKYRTYPEYNLPVLGVELGVEPKFNLTALAVVVGVAAVNAVACVEGAPKLKPV